MASLSVPCVFQRTMMRNTTGGQPGSSVLMQTTTTGWSLIAAAGVVAWHHGCLHASHQEFSPQLCSQFQLPVTAQPWNQQLMTEVVVLCLLCGNPTLSSWLLASGQPRPSSLGTGGAHQQVMSICEGGGLSNNFFKTLKKTATVNIYISPGRMLSYETLCVKLF